MQIVNLSPFRDARGKLNSGAQQEARQRGAEWLAAMRGQEAVVQALAEPLDDSFALLLNGLLPQSDLELDLVLVGPNGVWVLQTVHAPGMYTIEGDNWMAYDTAQLQFAPVEQNPVRQAREGSMRLYEHLHEKDWPVPWINSLLVVTSRDVNIRAKDSAVAILQLDRIPRYVTQDILALEPVMDSADVREVVSVLTAYLSASQPAAEGERASRFLGMTRAQWLIVVLMALMNVCVLCGFAFIVLRGSFF